MKHQIIPTLAMFLLVIGIGLSATTVNLVTPADNATTTTADNTFTFNYTGADATLSCALIMDGSTVATNATTANNTNTELTHTFTRGDDGGQSHTWKVTCDTTDSATRTLTVNGFIANYETENIGTIIIDFLGNVLATLTNMASPLFWGVLLGVLVVGLFTGIRFLFK